MASQKLPAVLTGTTTRFHGKGRKLGYPTANFKSATDIADGVYFGVSDLGKFYRHPSIIFIGVPTTLGDSEHRIEAHLLDIPDADYYGLQIKTTLHHFHRPNQTFDSINTLIAAMKADEAAIRRWLNGSARRPS